MIAMHTATIIVFMVSFPFLRVIKTSYLENVYLIYSWDSTYFWR